MDLSNIPIDLLTLEHRLVSEMHQSHDWNDACVGMCLHFDRCAECPLADGVCQGLYDPSADWYVRRDAYLSLLKEEIICRNVSNLHERGGDR